MSMRDSIIIVRGAGDLATGVIYPLARCGFRDGNRAADGDPAERRFFGSHL